MGCLQGSVFEPLLFLIYVNDMFKASDKLEFHLFTDDTNFGLVAWGQGWHLAGNGWFSRLGYRLLWYRLGKREGFDLWVAKDLSVG